MPLVTGCSTTTPSPYPGGAPQHGIRSAVPRRLYADHAKRWLDLTLVLLTAPISLPLILMLALLLLLSGQRPFYRQRRIGRGGRVFQMLKLRTMTRDADLRLAAHLARDPKARREWEQHQKLRHDPRVTPLGRVLRATSLDELPQLWNVLRGEMALVGPRPFLESQRGLYPGQAYYSLRPGLTGPWQVAARNRCSFTEREGYDTAYASTLCLRLDLRILLRTCGVMLRGEGC